MRSMTDGCGWDSGAMKRPPAVLTENVESKPRDSAPALHAARGRAHMTSKEALKERSKKGQKNSSNVAEIAAVAHEGCVFSAA